MLVNAAKMLARDAKNGEDPNPLIPRITCRQAMSDRDGTVFIGAH
jgi:hypothetical protein